MSIQNLGQLSVVKRIIPVMLKNMKGFHEHTKKKYGGSMSIPTDKSFPRNMHPEYNDEPSNADSVEMEDIYVPYEGYKDEDWISKVPEVDIYQVL